MKRILFSLLISLFFIGGFAQNYNELLTSPNASFFEVNADSDEHLIVQNYTSIADSFVVLALCDGRWVFLYRTPEIIPYKIARGNGIINDSYYRFIHKSDIQLSEIAGYNKQTTMIAIIPSNNRKVRANFQRQSWDLIIKIYDEDSKYGISDCGLITRNDATTKTLQEAAAQAIVAKEKLQQLKGFFEDGLITEEEYTEKKKQILDSF